jgi:trimeric autotransporter adhesin
VTNLTAQNQTFTSALDAGTQPSLPYTIAETQSDCAVAGISTKLLAPGAICHITLGLTASNSSTNDGAVHQNWLIGARDLKLTAYTQAAALSLSAPQIDFGTQYPNGLRSPRYLYLSNNSTVPIKHTAITLPAASPFSITDACPDLLQPLTACQLKLTYQSAHAPSSDSVTLSLDQDLTALFTGTTLPQPAATTSPSLVFSATSINFAIPVPVTAISATTQTVTLQNTGTSSAPLTFSLTGDFTDTTSCASPLAPNASCNIVFTFAPSQPGTRNGLLTLTSGTGVAYVNLSGTGAAALSPANNSTLNFGDVIAGQRQFSGTKSSRPTPSSPPLSPPQPPTPRRSSKISASATGSHPPPPSHPTSPAPVLTAGWASASFHQRLVPNQPYSPYHLLQRRQHVPPRTHRDRRLRNRSAAHTGRAGIRPHCGQQLESTSSLRLL